MSAVSELAPDTAMVLGIASTAMPYARTREEQAERWLRVLRMHGEVGVALRALGVAEGSRHDLGGSHHDEHTDSSDSSDLDAVELVTRQAAQIAAERDAQGVATTDLLLAVMYVYGADFDNVLHAHGTSRGELIERLGAQADVPRPG
ncbi:MAG TPA: hypothetical protein VGI26_04345 [Solirubrobacteraceae bacterium]|jgi:hypothetical protein